MSELATLSCIPEEYRRFWVPFKKRDTFLYHLTVRDSWEVIRTIGYLEPRDPAPKHWAGMHAVFMSDPHDPWYQENQKRVQKHVKEKGERLVRLRILTRNELMRCIDPLRTSQVISLDPIFLNEVQELIIV